VGNKKALKRRVICESLPERDAFDESILSTKTDEFLLDKAMGTTAGAAMIYQIMWSIGLIIGK